MEPLAKEPEHSGIPDAEEAGDQVCRESRGNEVAYSLGGLEN